MDIIEYQPLQHAEHVAELWQRTLGDSYPITERVWRPRLVNRASLEPGDGLLMLDSGRIIGFGILEIDRTALLPPASVSIQALLVDPAYQRGGVGSALLARLEAVAREAGYPEILACGGLNRFWSGVPEDLPAAKAFVEKHGYAANYQAIDLAGPIAGYRMPSCYREQMQAMEITVTGMTDTAIGQVYDFLTHEMPGWRGSMLQFIHHGDLGDVLVVRHGEDIAGCIQTYTPRTRYRGANVAWEGIYGREMGGFGAVIIAKDWRGKGLGQVMCQAAAEHIAAHGATTCYIDWTSDALAPFYGKVGAAICKRFGMYGKSFDFEKE